MLSIFREDKNTVRVSIDDNFFLNIPHSLPTSYGGVEICPTSKNNFMIWRKSEVLDVGQIIINGNTELVEGDPIEINNAILPYTFTIYQELLDV
jgi:hypothetical protein